MTTVTQRGATSTVTGPNGVYKVRKHATKRGKWQIFRFEANRKKLVATEHWHGRPGAVWQAINLAQGY
jgi:hypothetical protein